VALVPSACAPDPTAVELAPVAAVAAQVPVKPVFVDRHCAKAGETRNTDAIPAAIARLRNAQPVSALALMSRARRLSGMAIDSPAAAPW
jgi:hypothetical protein